MKTVIALLLLCSLAEARSPVDATPIDTPSTAQSPADETNAGRASSDRAARERAARQRVTARAVQRAAQRRTEIAKLQTLGSDGWASPAQFSYPGSGGGSQSRSVYTCSPMPGLGGP